MHGLTSEQWERLEEYLGDPDDPQAMERVRALVADGWEFLGVRFSQGLWLFRRPSESTADCETGDDLTAGASNVVGMSPHAD